MGQVQQRFHGRQMGEGKQKCWGCEWGEARVPEGTVLEGSQAEHSTEEGAWRIYSLPVHVVGLPQTLRTAEGKAKGGQRGHRRRTPAL